MATPNELLNKIQQLKDWQQRDFPRLMQARAEAFLKNNFRQQGYVDNGLKPWTKRKDDPRPGGAILVGKQSGLLRDAMRCEATTFQLRVMNDKPYAKIHNEGGTIVQTPTAKQKKFFWAKHAEAKSRNRTKEADMYKAMALAKSLNINIPQRQFMPIPDRSDMPRELGAIIEKDIETVVNKIMV